MNKTLKFVILIVFVVNCDSLSYNLKDGIRVKRTTPDSYQIHVKREFERVGNQIQNLIDNLEALESNLLRKIDGISDGLEVVQSDLKKVSDKTSLLNEVHLKETGNIKLDIEKVSQNLSKLNVTTQAHSQILSVIKRNLDELVAELKQEMEANFEIFNASSSKSASLAQLQLNETALLKKETEELSQQINKVNQSAIQVFKLSETLKSTIEEMEGNYHNLEGFIFEMWSRMSEMNSTMREAHIGISVAVFKTKNLNATFERVTEGLETTFGVLFHQEKPNIVKQVAYEMVGKSCKELQSKYNLTKSGEYFIKPSSDKSKNIKIYCDMESDGGGWSVIQRRGVRDIPLRQRESFYRNRVEYENGFGQVGDDHWIGLNTIHLLTNEEPCGTKLMVNLMKWDGTEKYAIHMYFRVSGSEDDYRLSVHGYQGNATDSGEIKTMLYNNNATFATFDKDNEHNCVAKRGGAWWYMECTWVNLNGEYSEDGKMGERKDRKGIYWHSRDTPWDSYSFKKTVMKIKSNC